LVRDGRSRTLNSDPPKTVGSCLSQRQRGWRFREVPDGPRRRTRSDRPPDSGLQFHAPCPRAWGVRHFPGVRAAHRATRPAHPVDGAGSCRTDTT